MPGRVQCGGVVCDEGFDCCLLDGKCFDPEQHPEACPVPDGVDACGANQHCAAGEYCAATELKLCLGPGTCVLNSGDDDDCNFSGGLSWCGCDGTTYPSLQVACRAGVRTPWHPGKCGELDTWYERKRLCGRDDQCLTDELCCPVTGACYPVSDPARCSFPNAIDGAEVGDLYPCTADQQCLPDQHCTTPSCSGTGTCVQHAEDNICGIVDNPVCGCDGATYTSPACAAEANVPISTEGSCE